MLEKVTIWTSITNGGDGSAHNQWYLTEAEATAAQNEDYENDEGWAEECIEMVETFSGSNIHISAVRNSKYRSVKNDF